MKTKIGARVVYTGLFLVGLRLLYWLFTKPELVALVCFGVAVVLCVLVILTLLYTLYEIGYETFEKWWLK